MKRLLSLVGTIFVLIFVLIAQTPHMNVHADQVIMVDVMYCIPEKSEFILNKKEREVAVDKVIRLLNSNVWGIFEDKNALGGAALGAPGDNDFASNFPLVYKLPIPIKAGEGGPWKMWARLNRKDDPNSFWWRVGQDGQKWKPNAFNIDTHGWNNPGAPLMIPDKPPWFWFDGIGNPDFLPGDNYLMLSNRESGIPPNVNLIDVISIRNDGKQPSDEEAEKLLAEQYKDIRGPLEKVEQSVSPSGKLTTTWGRLKRD